MKTFLQVLILVGALLSVPFSGNCKETITIVADQWPPFNLDADGDEKGYMIDIAEAVFKEYGIQVVYENIPWNRALFETKKGSYNAVVGASKTDARDFVFPQEELARNAIAFYIRENDIWHFKCLSSLETVRLGVVDGYDYRSWLNAYILENRKNPKRIQVMTGDDPLTRNLKKLIDNRIDVVVGNNVAIPYAAKNIGVQGKIKPAWFGAEIAMIYIAFSPKLEASQRYADLLSNGIRKLRKTGQIDVILKRYGLQDWQKGKQQPDKE